LTVVEGVGVEGLGAYFGFSALGDYFTAYLDAC
jgi:hypothetical protein